MDQKEPPPPYSGEFTNKGYGFSSEHSTAPPVTSPYQQGQHPTAPPVTSPYQQGPVVYPPAPNIILTQPQAPPSNNIVVVNSGGGLPGCPVCHNGSWTGTYSCCAWLLCWFCFPCGLICCLCMRKKKCTKCGYTVG